MSEKIGVKRWYTVQVMSGQENRVVESLTNRHQRNLDNGVDDGMEELLLPTKKVIERKDKKEYVRQQKSFPGYVFVCARIYDETGRVIPEFWQFIKDTKGVINFMGGESPIPLSDDEVSHLLQVEEDSDKPMPTKNWKVGDVVVVKDGAFESLEGVVDSVDEERHRLKVSLTIFGRSTICDVHLWQLEASEEPRG